MRFRATTTYFLATTILTQSCLPAFAQWDDIQNIEKHVEVLKQGAIPARLNFKADPDHTAGGCLNYARHEGKIKILLLLRDDEDTYANPAGKTDKVDGSDIFRTAARETGEETLNFYCPHPEFLKTQKFVDLYSHKPGINDKDTVPHLTRTIFNEVEYIDPKILNDRLKNAAKLGLSHHQRECRGIIWADGEDIQKAVQTGSPKFVESNTNTERMLYGPLFQTLQTETAQSIIQSLILSTKTSTPLTSTDQNTSSQHTSTSTATNTASHQHSHRTQIKNQLHFEGVTTVQKNNKLAWDFPIINPDKIAKDAEEAAKSNLKSLKRKADIIKAGKDKFETVVFQPNSHETVNFDADAFGKTRLRLPTIGNVNHHQEITYDFTKNRTTFGIADAALGQAVVDIKTRFNEAPNVDKRKRQLDALKALDDHYYQQNKDLIQKSTTAG